MRIDRILQRLGLRNTRGGGVIDSTTIDAVDEYQSLRRTISYEKPIGQSPPEKLHWFYGQSHTLPRDSAIGLVTEYPSVFVLEEENQ
jgi:hypothetical protein